MANEYVADGIYRVSGLKTKMTDGAWSSDPGMYLVADELKLSSITGASPGEIAFTAGYGHVWQLDAYGTTWVEIQTPRSLSINATPVSSLSIGGGWVDLALDRSYDDILRAASSGKCVINLVYGSTETIACHQSETFRYGNNTNVSFTGMFLDNVLFIINIMVTASSAQAMIAGTIALS